MISAIVLAAGKSERMDRCKQLANFGDKCMVDQVISSVEKSKVGEIIVVLGHRAEDIRRKISKRDVKMVINEEYEEGMSTSLKAGLLKVSDRTDAVLAVLADQPLIEPETIDRLIDEYRKSESSIVAPIYKGVRGNPVILDISLRDKLMNIRGDIGARNILNDRRDEIREVEVDTPSVVFDVNTREDLEKVRKNFGG